MDSRGISWTLMESRGLLWNLMDSYGISWTLVESCPVIIKVGVLSESISYYNKVLEFNNKAKFL